jgi:hypothetical protein
MNTIQHNTIPCSTDATFGRTNKNACWIKENVNARNVKSRFPCIVKVTVLSLRWMGLVTHIGDTKHAYSISWRNLNGN